MISLILTVLNEKQNLEAWFHSIRRQTISPDEIVIVDGGSSDGTWEFLQQCAEHDSLLHVFQDVGNISHGRNRAIQEAHGDTIVVTDAGCTYDPSWFAKLTAPIVAGGARSAATGFGPGTGPSDTALTIAIASATTPAAHEFQRNWLPSSRSVAFTKDLWHTVGGYPLWLPYSEDLVFDLALQKITPFTYIREPLVFWRPRTTLGAYWRQLRNYTASQVSARLFTSRHVLRLLGALCLAALLGNQHYAVALLAVVVCAYRYLRRAFDFSAHHTFGQKFCIILLVPGVVLFGECAKLYGTFVGVIRNANYARSQATPLQ